MQRNEALPGVLGNRGKRVIISGEQGNKGQILRGTGEQRQYWGTGNIRKQFFDFGGTGEQANLFQGNKGTGTHPGRASEIMEKLLFNLQHMSVLKAQLRQRISNICQYMVWHLICHLFRYLRTHIFYNISALYMYLAH